MVAVFLLRVDSVTSKGEGEVYYVRELGVINCNFWSSPKLTDHQVIIANGKKAIGRVFETNPNHHITEGMFKHATLPTTQQIAAWSDEKLLSVIQSGESINWDCGLSEEQSEIDDYVEFLYSEKERRKI